MKRKLCLFGFLLMLGTGSTWTKEFVPKGSRVKLTNDLTILNKSFIVEKHNWKCEFKFKKKNRTLRQGTEIEISDSLYNYQSGYEDGCYGTGIDTIKCENDYYYYKGKLKIKFKDKNIKSLICEGASTTLEGEKLQELTPATLSDLFECGLVIIPGKETGFDNC